MPKKLTTEEFIKRVIEIHGGKYDYTKVNYVDNKSMVDIICKNHGIFRLLPNKHLSNRGCQICSKNTMNTNKFIHRANIVHNNRYDYSKSIYTGYKHKTIIICKKHGEFKQSIGNHLCGKGCPKCASEKNGKNRRLELQDFISHSKKIHKNKYNYSIVNYIGNSKKIIIICPMHGQFTQRVDHHMNGAGCQKCHHRISKPENQFLDYLKIKDRQKNICGKQIDGIDYRTNTIYEFLGDFWHGNPIKFDDNNTHPFIKLTYKEIRKKTFDKLYYLKLLGYNVKYIWESDWRKYINKIDESPKIHTI